MTPYFADTHYFVALLNPSDQAHAKANLFIDSVSRPIVTRAWIITELANTFAGSRSRSIAAEFIQALSRNRDVELIPPERGLFLRGFDLYRSRPDKSWSLTDCISFTVMQERGLTDALTGDHHFEQAGFRALLR